MFCKESHILIVGLGLIGGCYAKALSRQGYSVRALTLDEPSIAYAKENGIIEDGDTAVSEEALAWADVLVFALYPHAFLEWIDTYGHRIRPGTLVTDVTGVKASVVYRVQEALPEGVEFIAAHPMAGRESSGVYNSDDRIFRDANYIVVPTEKNTKQAIDACCELGHVLGFRDVSVLGVEEHDTMIAFLSQLTHAIAVSLMCACDAPDLERYTGDSFRDLTRIAKINDEMWSELFLSNREALLKEMDDYRKAFDDMYRAVLENDRESMRRMMRLSTERRLKFEKKKEGNSL